MHLFGWKPYSLVIGLNNIFLREKYPDSQYAEGIFPDFHPCWKVRKGGFCLSWTVFCQIVSRVYTRSVIFKYRRYFPEYYRHNFSKTLNELEW